MDYSEFSVKIKNPREQKVEAKMAFLRQLLIDFPDATDHEIVEIAKKRKCHCNKTDIWRVRNPEKYKEDNAARLVKTNKKNSTFEQQCVNKLRGFSNDSIIPRPSMQECAFVRDLFIDTYPEILCYISGKKISLRDLKLWLQDHIFANRTKGSYWWNYGIVTPRVNAMKVDQTPEDYIYSSLVGLNNVGYKCEGELPYLRPPWWVDPNFFNYPEIECAGPIPDEVFYNADTGRKPKFYTEPKLRSIPIQNP